MQLIELSKMEYDFSLIYRGAVCPIDLDAPIEFPITDHNGDTVHRPGCVGIICRMDCSTTLAPINLREWVIYVQTYRKIE